MTIKRVLIPFLLMITATVASADSWKCGYLGKWTTHGSAGTAEFAWSLTWRSVDGGWKVEGNYSDKYGKSTLDGTCSNRACNLKQHYYSGSLDGKNYFWQGTYTESMESPTKTINKFTGTWGDAPDKRDNGGTWNAKAICERQSK